MQPARFGCRHIAALRSTSAAATVVPSQLRTRLSGTASTSAALVVSPQRRAMADALVHLATHPLVFMHTMLTTARPFVEASVEGEEAAEPAAPDAAPSATAKQPFCCNRGASSSFSSAPRYLVVGLGNPGYPFTGTRHNIGRDLVQELQTSWIEEATGADADQDSTPATRNHKSKKGKKAQKEEDAAPHLVKICASRVATVQARRMRHLHLERNAGLVLPLPSSSSSATLPTPLPCSACSSPADASLTGDVDSLSSSCCQCAILLATPDTPMNLSGRSVSALSRHYRIPARRIVLVYDELSLPIGTIRIKTSGRSGGQKGVQSVLDAMGGERACDGMVRMRVGIGPPQVASSSASSAASQPGGSSSSSARGGQKVTAVPFATGANVASYVMRSFSVEEQPVMRQVRERVQQALLQILAPTQPTISQQSVADHSSPALTPPGVIATPPCCCALAGDSHTALAHRLQHTMTRFNGAHVAAVEAD